jgi:hypothetical protein
VRDPQRACAAAIAVLLLGCSPPEAPQLTAPAPAPAARGPAFLKGQLHLHSSSSGDSQTPPADVVRWYADAGFDFIVFTDHNRITEQPGQGDMLSFPGIELTQNLDTCDPPPERELQCLLHVNALFVDPARASSLSALPRPQSVERFAIYRHAIEAAAALGGIAVLDHPNFHYAADAALIGSLVEGGLRFFEVANEAVDSNNEGDATHPSTEAIWDSVLGQGLQLYGVATDDAHHYDDAARVRSEGGLAHVGDRGFVMVRAERDGDAIRSALERGDFYASNGLLLGDVRREGDVLRIDASEDVTVTFIGDAGRTLATEKGRSASIDLRATASSYVRARVVDGRGRTAWIQPHRP